MVGGCEGGEGEIEECGDDENGCERDETQLRPSKCDSWEPHGGAFQHRMSTKENCSSFSFSSLQLLDGAASG